ncbi:MAG: N-acetyltransferase [Filomicrobium sp.]
MAHSQRTCGDLLLEATSLTSIDSNAQSAAGNELVVRSACPDDLAAIRAVHQRALGPGRYALTAYRVREGTQTFSPYCQVAISNGALVGALRFTPILVGGDAGAILLGPLAVAPDRANTGIGRELIEAGIAAARADGVQLIILVGDMAYYGRFGFVQVPQFRMTFPGPVNPARILALETVPGALEKFSGPLTAA